MSELAFINSLQSDRVVLLFTDDKAVDAILINTYNEVCPFVAHFRSLSSYYRY